MSRVKLKRFQWSLSMFICTYLFMMVPDMIDQGYFLLGFMSLLFSISYGILSVYKYLKWNDSN